MKTYTYLLLSFFTHMFLHAQTPLSSEWSQVRIGGGGYISGMKIHPDNNNIQYLRTDVGGAYRWDPAKKELVQILNFPFEKKQYYGVAGIALHRARQNVVYLAVDRGNTHKTSKILYSDNYGRDWEEIQVPAGVKFGANGGREGGTGIQDTDREGSPIAIHPVTGELWVGTRESGLWVLNPAENNTWRKIQSIPDNTGEQSIRSVLFHSQSPHVILVGYYGKGIYRSTNGGLTFEQIGGHLPNLNLVADMSLSRDGDKLYIAVRNQGIYRLNNPATSATSWKKLNIPVSGKFRGYQTVTASPHDNNLVMASEALSSGNNLARLQVSADGGERWVSKNNTKLINSFPWKDVNNSAGTHTSQIVFDPKDSRKLYQTSWFGMWYTDNWTASTVTWKNDRAKGHEEIVPSGLFAFPENSTENTLAVNSADYPGILVKNPDSYQNSDIRKLLGKDAYFKKGVDFTACEKFPNNIVLSGTNEWNEDETKEPFVGALFFSANGGRTYQRMPGYQENWGKALVAVASNDPSNLVAVHGDQVHYTRDGGATFQKAALSRTGTLVEPNVFVPHYPIASDLEAKNTFYIYDRHTGQVYRSTNGGENWQKAKGSLPIHSDKFSRVSLKTTPGKVGHLWLNHPGQGLYKSTNGGDSWTKVNTFNQARSLALGKAESSEDYPAVYVVGKRSGDRTLHLYSSTDGGRVWRQIRTDDAKFATNAKYMAADRSVFGKIYIGVEGLGVWQGQVIPDQKSALIADGEYVIRDPRLGQYIVSKAKENHAARMADPLSDSDRKWRFRHLGQNIYTIQNVASGRYLEVPNGVCVNGTRVATWSNANGDHKKWKVVQNGDYYILQPLHCLETALDRRNGIKYANVQMWRYSSANANQRWEIVNTGAKEIDENVTEDITIYPNPASSQVSIDMQDTAKIQEIRFYNTQGLLVKKMEVQNPLNQIALEGISPGIYLIAIRNSTGRIHHRKLIVK